MAVEDRVALRFAMEFDTPEQKQKYLEAHPGADPAKHTVKQPEKQAPEEDSEGDPEKGQDDDHGHGSHSFMGGLRSLAKKLKDAPAALAKLKDAPKEVKEFLGDKKRRNEGMKAAAKALVKSPGVYSKKLWETVKHEAVEVKDATAGVAKTMLGENISDKEKKAIKTVSTHFAIAGTAALLTAHTPALAASAFGLAMAKHIGLKAGAEVLADLHVLGELGHIGHGIAHIMEKLAAEEGKDAKTQEALSALVLKKVQEQLEKGLSDEDLVEILKSMGDDETSEKVARRVLAMGSLDTQTLRQIRGELRKLRAWSAGFFNALRIAQEEGYEAPDGFVWQDEFVEFWAPFGPIQKRLFELQDSLPPDLAGSVDDFVDPPKPARIEEAINDPKFLKREGKDAIAYAEADLLEWYEAFTWWVGYGIDGIDSLIS